MMHMRDDELTRFVRDNIEPLEDSIYGNRYRAAARLSDGTYLPCVVFQSKQAQTKLALRRFKELRWKRSQYEAVVESFVASGSSVAGYHIKGVELSPFAWPAELLRTIHGETSMGWTAFVAEMKDGSMFSYGTQFCVEFFDLPAGYTYADVQQIHSGMVYSKTRGLEAFSADAYKETVDKYAHSPCLRERPFFTCYIDAL
jgi:hypothetical protein